MRYIRCEEDEIFIFGTELVNKYFNGRRVDFRPLQFWQDLAQHSDAMD